MISVILTLYNVQYLQDGDSILFKTVKYKDSIINVEELIYHHTINDSYSGYSTVKCLETRLNNCVLTPVEIY